MLRHQHKNTIINTQDNVTRSESSNTTTVGPIKCNIAKAQDKKFKTAIVNMLKDLKEDMNRSFKEICKNTKKQWNEMMNTLQDNKIEI